jgi:L-iditol 2-dehydrogenase
MQAAQLIAPREFRVVEQTLEPPAPGEVQVQVHSVGICGSDLHAYAEGGIGDMPCQFPMVLGHEPSGTVLSTGDGVTGWSPGDRVALEPALYCYHCEFCRSGRHNVCSNIRFYSNPGVPGFFRERMNLPAANLLGVPQGLALEAATLVEPLAIALHSLRIGAFQKGETVAVFGGGPIGLLTIACLKVAGAGRIWATEPVAARRDMARRMGADEVFDPGAGDVVREILAATGGRGVDCAIDCAAKQDTTNQAIRASRNAGRVLLTGIHSEVLVPVDVSPFRRKELSILAIRRSNHESHDALELLVSQIAWIAPIVTHARPLDEIGEAFRLTGNYEDGVGKMVIRCGAGG